MYFKEAQLKAAEMTLDETMAFNRLMLKNYDKAQKEIIAEIERFYGKYLSVMSGKGNKQDIYNIVIQNDRLNNLLKETQKIYSYYSNKVGGDIKATSSAAMNSGYYKQQYILDWFSPQVLSFSILDKRLVEIAVTGSTEKWAEIAADVRARVKLKDLVPEYGSLADLLYKNKIQDLSKIQQTITQGFIQGQSVNQMSGNIQNIMENFKYQADRIALTESARTASEGSLLSSQDAAAKGVQLKRQWYATRSAKTRDSHASIDGQRVEVNEPFIYGEFTTMSIGKWGSPALDINCRCTIIDIINDENPELMRGRKDPLDPKSKNEVMTFKSYNEWAKEKKIK